MRAFVTGGSGFVGRVLIGALRERGDEVCALARSDQAAGAVSSAGAKLVVRSDLDDAAALAQGMSGCQVVFHAAAKVEQWGKPADFHRINVLGTERVLAAASAAGVARLVHISSEAVLAEGKPIVAADETWPLPERPIGLYPLTKGLAERSVLGANRDGLATVIVRPRFIWGKGDTSVLPKLVTAVQTGRFAWFGGGHYPTSTCHVRNVCHGALLAAERGRPGEIYFLTDGDPIDFREFVTAMLQSQGVQATARSVPHWLARLLAAGSEALWRMFDLRGDPPLTRTALNLIGGEVTVSDAKARRELGYRAIVDRAAGLAEMVP